MPGRRKGRCQPSWRAARQQERRMAFLTMKNPARSKEKQIWRNPFMGKRYDDYYDYDDGLTREQRREKRVRKRKRQILLLRISVAFFSVLVIGCAAVLTSYLVKKGTISLSFLPSSANTSSQGSAGQAAAQSGNDPVNGSDDSTAADHSAAQDEEAQAVAEATPVSQDVQAQPAPQAVEAPAEDEPAAENTGSVENADAVLSEAALLAAGYDYDAAINLLKSVPGYENDSALTSAIAGYDEIRSSCVAVDVNTVPHIFYHSLINDTDRAFDVSVLGQSTVDGMNAWMTTIDEFDKITQQLYDNGYVYVRLRDLVVETTGEDGTPHFEPNTHLMLPPGKKAIVLSVDDLSYYHSYKPAGFPDKLVLNEEGLVKCQYESADGSVSVGDYDVVPRLNTFLREHPDGSYHGARGLIALTGYNGVFGYRTDIDYEVKEHLVSDQAAWLDAHPDFSRDEDIAQAKVIAQAIMDEGWEFASHTWGHISVTGADAGTLQVDNEKWINNVSNIVGPTDTIIFAHGNDIGDWQEYSPDNPKYNYYRSAGYYFYCNVDGSVPYWVQIRGNYVRQGRINMDGYMLYQASTGQTDVLNSLIDPVSVFDSRRPTPVIANGQG